MANIYFDDFNEVLNREMLKATKSVKIAVAWVNFKMYKELFGKLIKNGVELKIVVNSDIKNSMYQKEIESLRKIGMKLKLLKMPTRSQYMHHKFCIIDNKTALIGSYNWTKNASYNNFENLVLIEDNLIIKKLLDEFKYLMSITTKDILKLQRIQKCKDCKEPAINICTLNQEGKYQAEVEIYKMCSCSSKNIFSEFYDISLYNNLISIHENWMEHSDNVHINQYEQGQIEAEYEYEVQRYLGSLLKEIREPIHAIGIRGEDIDQFGESETFVQILWKNRFVSKILEDRYYDL